MVLIADDLSAWLVAVLADGVRRKLTTLVLGDELDRALGAAAKAAIELTAADLCPDDAEQAQQVAAVIDQVFRTPVSEGLLARHTTMLNAIEAGITNQLAVLNDASLTGTGVSSAGVLGISAGVLADKLNGHLVQQIALRATRGGALARAVPIDLVRKLAVDDEKSVAARGAELLRILSGITDADRWDYRHRFGI